MNEQYNILYIKVPGAGGGYDELIAAEPVDTLHYRLVENPVGHGQLNYGTMVSVATNETGELQVDEITGVSQFKTRQFIRASTLTENELKEKIGKELSAIGGCWQTGCGALAYAHIPKNSSFDLDALFDQNNYYPLEITHAA